jgi:hypothetical protein
MTLRSITIFFWVSLLAFSLHGQSKKADRPNLKGTTYSDYFVTVKLVDKEPKYKPTYLFAKKLDPKQKKWNLDTTKIYIDKYFLTNKSIQFVSYSAMDCACDLFGDTTGNGVVFIHLKPSAKFQTIPKVLEMLKLSIEDVGKSEIYINGKQLTDDTILIDSEAEVFPIYRKGEAVSKNNVVGVEIWTLTEKQRKKYGM